MPDESPPKDPRLVETDVEAAKLDLKLKRLDLREKRSKARHERWLRRTTREQAAYEEAFEDFNFGTVRFTSEVYRGSVERARQQLRALAVLRPGQPIRFEINSPGGYIHNGLDLFDEMRRVAADVASKQDDDPSPALTTVIYGHAASMAGVLAQAGDVRIIRPNAYLHLHAASGGTWGRVDEMEDDVQLWRRQTKHIARIYAERATASGRPTSTREVRDLFARRELWLNAEQALRLGFVDLVA